MLTVRLHVSYFQVSQCRKKVISFPLITVGLDIHTNNCTFNYIKVISDHDYQLSIDLIGMLFKVINIVIIWCIIVPNHINLLIRITG